MDEGISISIIIRDARVSAGQAEIVLVLVLVSVLALVLVLA